MPLWLSAVGGLLFLPGILWVAASGTRLNDDDASIALQPLTRIHLDGIDNGPLSAALIVPNTARWTRIRKACGEPEFVISAVEPTGRFALCLPEMPVRIELNDQTGRVIPLQPDGGPYGYSTSCESSSLRFHAALGGGFTLKVTKTGIRIVPAGDLIVVSDWYNMKDKLVGLSLDHDVESLVTWLSIVGFLLVLSGAGVFTRNRVCHHRGE
ncbi:MAG TPA: hypothetical protein VNY05_41895 [Candidatus Acidoferrales bacterium]|nr:hypothetical protein [Candidatus Acidoferrales bacterium]